jgi:procollagen-lysine,2-oxoglutarate 5-dioxygenase, invertebrate
LSKISYKHNELDPDMAFALHLRRQGVFMFVSNINYYGHLINTDAFDTKRTRPDFYEFFTNSYDWEKRYIHKSYFDQLLPESVPKQPCTDVFWFPIASEIFCETLIDIMETFGKWSDGSPNDKRLEGGYEAVPTRDIHMNQVGLGKMLNFV